MIIGVVIIATHIQVAKADCNLNSLISCFLAINDPIITPPPRCCTNLKAQQPCFFQYLKDPDYKKYLTAGAKIVADACGLVFPPNV